MSKKGDARESLLELLLELQEEQEQARNEHKDGNSDSCYYGAAAKLEILDKVVPVLRQAVKSLKGEAK